MARADVTPTKVLSTGIDLDAIGVLIGADGVAFANNGAVILVLMNTTIGPITVTVETPATFDGDLVLADRDIVVPASDTTFVGPLSPRLYNQDGKVHADVAGADADDILAAVVYL